MAVCAINISITALRTALQCCEKNAMHYILFRCKKLHCSLHCTLFTALVSHFSSLPCTVHYTVCTIHCTVYTRAQFNVMQCAVYKAVHCVLVHSHWSSTVLCTMQCTLRRCAALLLQIFPISLPPTQCYLPEIIKIIVIVIVVIIIVTLSS